MTEETYEELIGKKSRNELYSALQAGLDQINNGEFIEEKEFFENVINHDKNPSLFATFLLI
jgi:hypothetical protein